MKLEHRPYPKLLHKMKEKYTKEKNAEMVALIIAAEYQFMTLIKIVNVKLMFQQTPAIASEAITTADEIAEKVLKNVEDEDGTEEQEA